MNPFRFPRSSHRNRSFGSGLEAWLLIAGLVLANFLAGAIFVVAVAKTTGGGL